MDLNNIFSQFMSGNKNTVYMSITPGIGLELISVDVHAKVVKNYAYRPLQYNDSLREIADIEAFKNAVMELFDELHLNIKSNIVLNLPLVLLGNMDLSVLLGDDAVTEALTSEVEQSYIFKRHEPIVSWVDSNSSRSGEMRKLFYSAIQQDAVDNIKVALTELGATLSGIEVSLTSTLKALEFSGLTTEQMKEGVSWNLMTISQNGYSICSMVGKNLIDYYEEPLAIKSFDGDEIYNAINASAQITLMSYPANYLFILSETDLVSAELLAGRMPFDGVVNFYDDNSFKKQDAIPTSLDVLEEVAQKISLEAIGTAVSSEVRLPVTFNFMGAHSSSDGGSDNQDEPVHVVLGSNEFDISPNNARNLAMIIALIIIIPVFLIFIAVPAVGKKKQASLDELNSNLSKVQAEIKRYEDELNKSGDFDVNTEVEKVLGTNRAKLMSYTALGEAVPKKLWLTYFEAKDAGKIDIKGEASNVEDVYTFYRNMKDLLIDTQLRLHKLEMKSSSVDDAVTIDPNAPTDYVFEITNMTANELNPPPPATGDANKPADASANQSDNKSAQPSLPLLNFGKNK